MAEKDSCLTLTRKLNCLKKIGKIPPERAEEFEKYLETMKKKIQIKKGKSKGKDKK